MIFFHQKSKSEVLKRRNPGKPLEEIENVDASNFPVSQTKSLSGEECDAEKRIFFLEGKKSEGYRLVSRTEGASLKEKDHVRQIYRSRFLNL